MGSKERLLGTPTHSTSLALPRRRSVPRHSPASARLARAVLLHEHEDQLLQREQRLFHYSPWELILYGAVVLSASVTFCRTQRQTTTKLRGRVHGLSKGIWQFGMMQQDPRDPLYEVWLRNLLPLTLLVSAHLLTGRLMLERSFSSRRRPRTSSSRAAGASTAALSSKSSPCSRSRADLAPRSLRSVSCGFEHPSPKVLLRTDWRSSFSQFWERLLFRSGGAANGNATTWRNLLFGVALALFLHGRRLWLLFAISATNYGITSLEDYAVSRIRSCGRRSSSRSTAQLTVSQHLLLDGVCDLFVWSIFVSNYLFFFLALLLDRHEPSLSLRGCLLLKQSSVAVLWRCACGSLLLRMISFSMDRHWHLVERPPGRPDGAMKRSSKGALLAYFDPLHGPDASASRVTFRSYLYSQEHSLGAEYYCPLWYFSYLFYPPTYLAGPYLSFNAWCASNNSIVNNNGAASVWCSSRNYNNRCHRSNAAIKRGQVSLLMGCILQICIVEFLSCKSFTAALVQSKANQKLWTQLSATELSVSCLFLLVKRACAIQAVWKFSELWALWDRQVVPLAESTSALFSMISMSSFWSHWNRSLYLWTLRYVYTPLRSAACYRTLSQAVAVLAILPITISLVPHSETLAWVIVLPVSSLLEEAACRGLFFVTGECKGSWKWREACVLRASYSFLLQVATYMMTFSGGLHLVGRLMREGTVLARNVSFWHLFASVAGAYSLACLVHYSYYSSHSQRRRSCSGEAPPYSNQPDESISEFSVKVNKVPD